MREAILFCVTMMVSAILMGQARFGGRQPSKWSDLRKGRPLFGTLSESQPEPKRPPPEEPGPGLPPETDGKPAPLIPRPGHHLVAANALPPSERVYLLPKD